VIHAMSEVDSLTPSSTYLPKLASEPQIIIGTQYCRASRQLCNRCEDQRCVAS
jgi:hypothetical protein